MVWQGVTLALLAACTHSVVDTTRKAAAANGIPPIALVNLPAILDAAVACSLVGLLGGFRNARLDHGSGTPFALAVLSTSALLLYSKLLYQKALALSPLSLTIPFLSFTPAILVGTAYVFVGEKPSWSGLIGVSIVAAGGYLLSLHSVSSSGKASRSTDGGGAPDPDDKASKAALHVHVSSAAAAAAAAVSGMVNTMTSSATPMSYKAHHRNGSLNSLLSTLGSGALNNGDIESQQSNQQQQPIQSQGMGDPNLPVASRKKQAGAVAAVTAAGGMNGACGSSKQEEPSRSARQPRVGSAESPPGSHPMRHLLPAVLMEQLRALRQEPGTLLMIGVAALWSVTASLDKVGVMNAPSVWVYFAIQRLCIGVAALMYLLLWGRSHFTYLRTHLFTLLVISALELAAVVLFLEAIRYIFVSYVVALKRCNILLSVVLGGLLFKESIASRLPYVFIMMLGMTLIVLEPKASWLHNTTHT